MMLFSLTAMANYAAAARFGYLLMAVQSEVIVLEKVKRFSLPLMRPPLDMHQQLQATGTHISLIAHITQRELTPNLHPTDVHNGLANRCLWAWVQRSNCLPDGEASASMSYRRRPRTPPRPRLATATPEIFLRRDDAARELWQDSIPP